MGSVSSLRDQAPHLVLVGVNHRTCPIEVREAILGRASYRRMVATRSRGLVEDLVLLTTCNRVEAYALSAQPDEARAALVRLLGPANDSGRMYALERVDASSHLFRVAAGLDSVAHGEEQIATQVRVAPDIRPSSWRRADGLRELFRRSARAAHHIRRIAQLDGAPMSASHAATRYFQQVLRMARPTIALLGSGKMARLAAEALRPRTDLIVANRDMEKARLTAARVGGRPASLRDLSRILREADAVLAATSAGKPLIRRGTLGRAMAARRGRPLWLVDLGVPRNIDPMCARVPGVTLLNIDDLAPWAWHPPDPEALARAERQIRDEAVLAVDALRPRPADLVAVLRREAEEWRRREVERALSRLPAATDEERRIVEKMAGRLVNRLLHAPTSMLRRMQAEGQAALVAELVGGWSDRGGSE